MNGVLQKRSQPEQPIQNLSADLVCSDEKLFRLSAAELKELEQAMFRLTQFEATALNQQGAAYVLMFNQQRKSLDQLRRFIESHPRYSPLANGRRLYDWLHAHNEPITRGSLHNAIVALRGQWPHGNAGAYFPRSLRCPVGVLAQDGELWLT